MNRVFHFKKLIMFTVDKKTQQKRMAICKQCDKRSNKFLSLFNYDSCSICKCLLKVKTSVTKEFDGKCPIGKW